MHPTLDQAIAELETLRRLVWQRLAVALGAGLVAASLALADLRLAFAFGVGAASEILLAGSSVVRRRTLVASLAIDPDAYVLPEVRRYGNSLTSLHTRRALARSIAAMLRQASTSGAGIELADRVTWQAPALAALARALGDSRNVVEPVAMAACVQLLTDGRTSPLLNPSVPRSELDRSVRCIHDGITPRRRGGSASMHRRSSRAA